MQLDHNFAHKPDLPYLDPHDDGIQGCGGDVRETFQCDVRETFQQSSQLLLRVGLLIPKGELETVLSS